MGTPVSSGNRGVLALGASLVNLCATAGQGAEVVLLLGHHNDQPASFRVAGQPRLIPVVNCRLSPRSRPRDHLAWILLMALLYRVLPVAGLRRAIARATPWIRAVEQAALVGDVRGGDSFSDIYGMKRFLLGFLTAWSVILVKGSLVQFPQTYGPYQSRLARVLARFLLRRSSTIIARDLASQRVARELVGPGQEVLLSPDVAFSLEPIVPPEIVLDPPLPPAAVPLRPGERVAHASGEVVAPSSILHPPSSDDAPLSAFSFQLSAFPKPIGLNVNGLMFNGGYTRSNMFGLKLDYASFLPELVRALMREHPGELWLVPHTFAPDGNVESDPEASRKLRDALPAELQARVRIVARAYDQHEIKGVIGLCDFFIGSRMHACIAALSQGIPCVGVAYSMKFRGVFESVGMADWVVDGRTATNEQAIQHTLDCYRQSVEVRVPLRSAVTNAQSRLREVFTDLTAAAIHA
jgi:colanic acid/amylovoran biosynthesis protein